MGVQRRGIKVKFLSYFCPHRFVQSNFLHSIKNSMKFRYRISRSWAKILYIVPSKFYLKFSFLIIIKIDRLNDRFKRLNEIR